MKASVLRVLVGVLLSGVASFFAVFSYVTTSQVADRLSDAFGGAVAWTPLLILNPLLLGLMLGTSLAASLLWPTRYRTAVILIAASGGALFGRFAAGNSPHISQRLAILCGAFAWAMTSAIALVALDRRPVDATPRS